MLPICDATCACDPILFPHLPAPRPRGITSWLAGPTRAGHEDGAHPETHSQGTPPRAPTRGDLTILPPQPRRISDPSPSPSLLPKSSARTRTRTARSLKLLPLLPRPRLLRDLQFQHAPTPTNPPHLATSPLGACGSGRRSPSLGGEDVRCARPGDGGRRGWRRGGGRRRELVPASRARASCIGRERWPRRRRRGGRPRPLPRGVRAPRRRRTRGGGGGDVRPGAPRPARGPLRQAPRQVTPLVPASPSLSLPRLASTPSPRRFGLVLGREGFPNRWGESHEFRGAGIAEFASARARIPPEMFIPCADSFALQRPY
jgi:hypothetical protein